MESDNDYETISQLMRGGTIKADSSDPNINASINELNKNIKSLISLFTDVKKELLEEYETNKGKGTFPSLQDDRVNKLEEKTDMLMEQNRHIAESIIALSEKLDSIHNSSTELHSPEIEDQLKQMNSSKQSLEMPDLELHDEPKHEETFGMQVTPEQHAFDDLHAEQEFQTAFPKVPETIHFGQTPTAGSLAMTPTRKPIDDFVPPAPPKPGVIDPGYPSHEGYPSLGQPQMSQELSIEPRQPRKKFMGMF